MITWKEKVSMFSMKCVMGVVVGCSKLVKPALDTVENYKKRWQENEDKRFLDRLAKVFDHTDLPLPDTNVIELGVLDEEGKKNSQAIADLFKNVDEIPTAVIDALKSLEGLMAQLEVNGPIDNSKKECVCCDCIEKCFCMDCPVHPEYRRKSSSSLTEIGGDAINDMRDTVLEIEKQVKDIPYLKSDTWQEPITLTSGYLQVNPLVPTPVIFETQKDVKKTTKTANKKKPAKKTKVKKTTKAKK